MTFLRSIGSDLIEKRLWPLVALLGVALVAVLVWVAMSGAGASSPVPPPAAANASGVAVTAAPPNPNEAVAETPTGARYQRQAGAHDPFVALGGGTSAHGATGASGPVATATTSTAGSGGASASSSSAPAIAPPATLTAPASTPPAPVTPPTSSKPAASAKPTATHPIDVRFGVIPTVTGPNGAVQTQPAQLTEHKDLPRLSPLPDAKSPIVVYMGMRPDGKTATFALMHEAILRGDGTCRPSALKCQLLDLRAGQKEQFDYVTPSLSIVRYELDVVSVGAQSMAQAAAVRYFHRESTPGRQLLKNHFPPGVGQLIYSYQSGSLLPSATARAATARSVSAPVTAPRAPGSPGYAPPLPHAGPPVVQPGWLGVLLHAL